MVFEIALVAVITEVSVFIIFPRSRPGTTGGDTAFLFPCQIGFILITLLNAFVFYLLQRCYSFLKRETRRWKSITFEPIIQTPFIRHFDRFGHSNHWTSSNVRIREDFMKWISENMAFYVFEKILTLNLVLLLTCTKHGSVIFKLLVDQTQCNGQTVRGRQNGCETNSFSYQSRSDFFNQLSCPCKELSHTLRCLPTYAHLICMYLRHKRCT